jgi:hypothetical protein
MTPRLLITLGTLSGSLLLLAGKWVEPLPTPADAATTAGLPSSSKQETTVGPRAQVPTRELPKILRTDDSRVVLGEKDRGTINTHEYFASFPDRAKLLAAASRMSVMTLGCLRAGACDETAPEDRPYFDPEKTAAQRLLEQSLRVLAEGASAGMAIAPDVNEADLLSAMELGNGESKLLALELLVQRSSITSTGMDPELFERILAERPRFSGEAAPLFYSQLGDLAEQNSALQPALSRSLQDTFERADASTVLELMRHIEDLRLSEPEYTRTIYDLCRFTAPAYPRANWRAMRHYLDRYRDTQGFRTSAIDLCRA